MSEVINAKYITRETNHMEYQPGMEIVPGNIMEQVLEAREGYDETKYTAADVIRALSKDVLTPEDFAALLSPAAQPYVELMAKRAQQETRKHFGNSIMMFTPCYIANYCENYCIYCGFNCHNKIRRGKLNMEEVDKEMAAIAASGLKEILILTGESRTMSPVEYIGEACKIARKYFTVIGVEIYPLNSDEYRHLHECGVDYVTVFQETYDPALYGKLHLAGRKRVFPYRANAQERAMRGGMRGAAFGALLGLGDFRRDAFACGLHAWLVQRAYPHAELSLSCPPLRPIAGNGSLGPRGVGERQLLQVMCAYRLLLPQAGITISSRERAGFRDQVMGIAATKISAGVSTGVGEHADGSTAGDDQFEIADGRDVAQVRAALRGVGLEPVMNDYVRL